MSVIEGQIQLRDLVMGKNTDYHLLRTNFFGWPANRAERIPEPNQNGWRFNTKDLFAGKTVEIEMLIKSADLPAAMRALSKAAHITESDETISLLVHWTLDDTPKRLVGRVRNLDFPSYDRKTFSSATECTLIFEAELPGFTGISEQSKTVLLPVASGGHTFDVTFPMSFGSVGSGGSFTVENQGNMPYQPRFRIDGPVVNPRITHQDQEKSLEFDITLSASDWLEIDARESEVLLNGTASRYYTLTNTSRWFTIDSGVNNLFYSASGYDPSSLLTTYWYDYYL